MSKTPVRKSFDRYIRKLQRREARYVTLREKAAVARKKATESADLRREIADMTRQIDALKRQIGSAEQSRRQDQDRIRSLGEQLEKRMPKVPRTANLKQYGEALTLLFNASDAHSWHKSIITIISVISETHDIDYEYCFRLFNIAKERNIDKPLSDFAGMIHEIATAYDEAHLTLQDKAHAAVMGEGELTVDFGDDIGQFKIQMQSD